MDETSLSGSMPYPALISIDLLPCRCPDAVDISFFWITGKNVNRRPGVPLAVHARDFGPAGLFKFGNSAIFEQTVETSAQVP